MELKLKDKLRHGKSVRRSRNQLSGKIEATLGSRSRKWRWLKKSLSENGAKMRIKVRKKFAKKAEFLKGKYDRKPRPVDDLNEADKYKYGEANVFKNEYEMKPEEEKDPLIVNMDEDEVKLSEDEKSVLVLGPKFCVLNDLSEETFMRELEVSIVKYRREMRNQEN